MILNAVEREAIKRLANAILSRNDKTAAYWLGRCDALGMITTTFVNAFNCSDLTPDEAQQESNRLKRLIKD